jgi:hypothetical protein
MIEIRLTKDDTRKLILYGYVDIGQVRIFISEPSKNEAFQLLVKRIGK